MKEELIKLKENIYLEADKIAKINKAQIVKAGEFERQYIISLEQLMNILKEVCPAECHYQEPYGFVPEAGCPIHD